MISFYASDDRYADDVHYRGGLVIPMDMAQWANCMLSWNALPPDPAIAGADWRAQWRARLERTPHFVERWLGTSAETTTGGTARPASTMRASAVP